MPRKCLVLLVFLIVMKPTYTRLQSTYLSQSQLEAELQQQLMDERAAKAFVPNPRRVIYAPEFCVPPMALDHLGRCRIVW